jgi:AraC-like DNA-binding protein
MSDRMEEGWSLGADNVPPWEKEARERRATEKQREAEALREQELLRLAERKKEKEEQLRREEARKARLLELEKMEPAATVESAVRSLHDDPSPQPSPARGEGAGAAEAVVMVGGQRIGRRAVRELADDPSPQPSPARGEGAAPGEFYSAKTNTADLAAKGDDASRAMRPAGDPARERLPVEGTKNETAEKTKKSAQSGGLRHMPWQQISGLYPEMEEPGKMSRSERRSAIRKLFKEYERRIREALSEEQPDAEAGERTFLWSPLDGICAELGIARRKLSSLTRELTGMSAQETIDRIRAEGIGEKAKAKLAEQARQEYAQYFAEDEKAYRKGSAQPDKAELERIYGRAHAEKMTARARAIAEAGLVIRPRSGWGGCASGLMQRAWNARRSQPRLGWSERRGYAALQQFAREMGFTSYARLYRACVLSSGKTPMELEYAAALVLLEEIDAEHEPMRARIKGE